MTTTRQAARAGSPYAGDDLPCSGYEPSNETFQNELNDVVLVSKDGKRFPHRRLYFEAASQPLADLVAHGGSSGSRKRDKDGHELMATDAEGAALENLLIFLNPRIDNPKFKSCSKLAGSVWPTNNDQGSSSIFLT
jgi:hypothetical protein